jgi:Tubulin binding cofactor C
MVPRSDVLMSSGPRAPVDSRRGRFGSGDTAVLPPVLGDGRFGDAAGGLPRPARDGAIPAFCGQPPGRTKSRGGRGFRARAHRTSHPHKVGFKKMNLFLFRSQLLQEEKFKFFGGEASLLVACGVAMGCFGSKEQSDSVAAAGQGYSWDKRREGAKDADEDESLEIADRKGEEVVRKQGSVGGDQFTVTNCKDCTVAVLDACDSVTIDGCSRCTFLLGPTSGSLFIRNSKQCRLIVACRQFRTRDCQDIDVLLYIASSPTIEATQNMRFGCFQFSYEGLAAQFESTSMDPFVNDWDNLHDFSNGPDSWTYLPLRDQKAILSDLAKFSDTRSSIVPHTFGRARTPPEEFSSQAAVVIGKDDFDLARKIASHLSGALVSDVADHDAKTDTTDDEGDEVFERKLLITLCGWVQEDDGARELVMVIAGREDSLVDIVKQIVGDSGKSKAERPPRVVGAKPARRYAADIVKSLAGAS